MNIIIWYLHYALISYYGSTPFFKTTFQHCIPASATGKNKSESASQHVIEPHLWSHICVCVWSCVKKATVPGTVGVCVSV